MSNKHTPGPWTYQPFHFKDAQGAIFMERAKGACTISLTGAASMSQKTLDAHARLIAAAPDLLAACEFVMERALQHSDPDDVDHAVYKRVSAAIAKAKGETK